MLPCTCSSNGKNKRAVISNMMLSRIVNSLAYEVPRFCFICTNSPCSRWNVFSNYELCVPSCFEDILCSRCYTESDTVSVVSKVSGVLIARPSFGNHYDWTVKYRVWHAFDSTCNISNGSDTHGNFHRSQITSQHAHMCASSNTFDFVKTAAVQLTTRKPYEVLVTTMTSVQKFAFADQSRYRYPYT